MRADTGWTVVAFLLSGACGSPRDAQDSRAPDAVAEAARLLADVRPYDARLTGSRRWAPCGAGARTRDATGVRCAPLAADETAAASALAARLAGSPRHAERDRATALLDLAFAGGNAGVIDRSVERLEAIALRPDASAPALSDAAVARLARADARRDAASLFAALDLVERAATLDRESPVIAFNRAVVAERLHLYDQAGAAWRAFLALEPRGEWADEARRRLAALAPAAATDGTEEWSAAAGRDPQGVREVVIDSLLPRWARAVEAGDTVVAGRMLGAALAAGSSLAARSGDSSAVHAARECAGASPPRAVSGAVRSYADGALAFRHGAFGAAAPHLRAAAHALRAAGAPALAAWAELLLAATKIYRAEYAGADALYARIAREGVARGDRALAARAAWGLALSSGRQGRAGESAEQYARAAARFAELGERANEGATRSQLADVLFLLGRDEPALEAKRQALVALDARRDPGARHALLLALGRQLRERDHAAAAIAVLREAVRAAPSTRRSKDRPEALIRLAEAEAADGRLATAGEHLAEAGAALVVVGDSLMRERLAMERATAEATVLARSTPRDALARLDTVLTYHARARLVAGLPAALVHRARLELRLGDTASAARDLRGALTVLEAQSRGVRGTAAALDAASTRRSVHRELIALALARDDTAQALAFARRARGEAAHGGTRAEGSEPVPPGVVSLAFSVLADETLVWIGTGGRTRLVRVRVTDRALRDAADRLERVLRRGDAVAEADVVARPLSALVQAAAPELRDARELALTTDGPLSRVPFAALRDESGRRLVERVAIRHVPAAALSAARPAESAGRARGALLVVGNPAFDRAAFPELDPLRDADAEVDAVRTAHGGGTAIGGAAATRQAVTRAMREAGLLHFAGHARLVPRAPALSHLVLAADSGGVAASMLSAAEIEQLDLSRLRLVVLSACGTTQARTARDDTGWGLPESFLDAGAGAVISSLWEADDRGTAVLMGELHRAIARGVSGPEALRAAQLSLIAGDPSLRSPRVWGAFRYTAR